LPLAPPDHERDERLRCDAFVQFCEFLRAPMNGGSAACGNSGDEIVRSGRRGEQPRQLPLAPRCPTCIRRGDVLLDRLDAEAQAFGDLFVCQPGRDEFRDLTLARRQ